MKVKLKSCISDQKLRMWLNAILSVVIKIEQDSNYKYLGFWMNEFLDLKFSIQESKIGYYSAKCYILKVFSAGGMTISVYNKLVETIVEPVLYFCSGI